MTSPTNHINLQPDQYQGSLGFPSDLRFFDGARALDNKYPIEYPAIRHAGPDPAGHSFDLDGFDFLRLMAQIANLVKKISAFKERNKIKGIKVVPVDRIGFASKEGRRITRTLHLMTYTLEYFSHLAAET